MSEKPSIYRLVAVAGYQAYAHSLVGKPAPAVRDYFERVREPREGDLVLEMSTFRMEPWEPGGLGWLLEFKQEPIQSVADHKAMMEEGDYWKRPGESYDAVPYEPVWYIDPLDPFATSPFRWTNADFIAIPTTYGEFTK